MAKAIKFDLASIEKLWDERNYASWRKKVRLALQLYGLLEIAEGSEQKPQHTATEAKKTAWEILDSKAQLVLLAVIEDDLYDFTESWESAAAIWKVATLYDSVDVSSKISTSHGATTKFGGRQRSNRSHVP